MHNIFDQVHNNTVWWLLMLSQNIKEAPCSFGEEMQKSKFWGRNINFTMKRISMAE